MKRWKHLDTLLSAMSVQELLVAHEVKASLTNFLSVFAGVDHCFRLEGLREACALWVLDRPVPFLEIPGHFLARIPSWSLKQREI